MSGIIGIIKLDGAPVERGLVQQMVDSMAFRGPDGQSLQLMQNAGLGHTLLRTTHEAAREQQPLSFDEQIWIVADARIDAREELIAKLHAAGCGQASLAQPDVELILHAYLVWEEECVKHLIGDYVFAILDRPKQKLFCARDHFGIKPFFYAQVENQFIFSNTLNTVRLHPAVSNELNEQAIGDYLLFESNLDLTTTVFKQIMRLPPAHTLSLTAQGLRVQCYWQMPEIELVHYRRKADYIDQFLDLFRKAVADRLRTASVSVFMSGGLDSSGVAAMVRALYPGSQAAVQLHAYTVVYDRLIPDEERYYADLVAKALEIPITYHVADDDLPFAGCESDAYRPPEPINQPFWLPAKERLKDIGRRHTVVLTGTDADTFFFELPNPHFAALYRERRWGKLVSEMVQYAITQGELPRIGLRAWLRGRKSQPKAIEFPVWLRPDFVKRQNLALRWADFNNETLRNQSNRPRIFGVLQTPMWSQCFEACDPSATSLPLEFRHPFADLRLFNFALSLPPMPWLMKKFLMRESFRGMLPEAVRSRMKSPLAGDPLVENFRNNPQCLPGHFKPEAKLLEYVDDKLMPPRFDFNDINLSSNLRTRSLNYWLKSVYNF